MTPEEERAGEAAWHLIGFAAAVALIGLLALVIIVPLHGPSLWLVGYGIYFSGVFLAGWIWLYLMKGRK